MDRYFEQLPGRWGAVWRDERVFGVCRMFIDNA